MAPSTRLAAACTPRAAPAGSAHRTMLISRAGHCDEHLMYVCSAGGGSLWWRKNCRKWVARLPLFSSCEDAASVSLSPFSFLIYQLQCKNRGRWELGFSSHLWLLKWEKHLLNSDEGVDAKLTHARHFYILQCKRRGSTKMYSPTSVIKRWNDSRNSKLVRITQRLRRVCNLGQHRSTPREVTKMSQSLLLGFA